MIRAAILGGTGYGGMELLRWLLGHPEVEVTAVTSRSEDGRVADRHEHLAGFTDLCFTTETEGGLAEIAAANDVLFQAKPHGVSALETPALLDANPGVRVVDLSGDFRLRDPGLYEPWYGWRHPHPDRVADAAYGLPECGGRKDLAGTRLVANPGCHATAATLALWPLASLAGGPAARASVTSMTGSSGSGASPSSGTHHPERFLSVKAYRPLEHQHLPEIHQSLGGALAVDFVPCSLPIARGIYVVAHVPVGTADGAAVRGAFEAAYGDEPFVRLRERPPEIRAVVGTNFADVHVTVREGTACVTVAIDNLGKGMAGTAVQNMNLLFGLDERAGLWQAAVGP